jgi:hypothetical protein
VAGRVGDDFMDVQGPLKQLERAAKAPQGIVIWLFKILYSDWLTSGS